MWARIAPASGDRRVDLVTLGENSLDFVAVAGADRAVGGKQRLRAFHVFPGGQTTTAAVAAARLGLRARYVGAFGADEWGRRSRATLDEAGVEVVAVEHRDAPSRVAVVIVDADGDRHVLEHRDARLRIDPIPAGAVESARVLIVDATDVAAAQAAARRGRAAGVPAIVDVDRVDEDVDALLDLIDVIVVPISFLEAATGASTPGAALERLAARYRSASAVVVTLGEEGSLARAQGREIRTPAYRVDVVDTTGAGDAFRGGFAAAWIRLGSGAPIDDVLRYANATAALNCRAVGAQTALPTWGDVEGRVTKGGG
ncbi:MAG TPA: carbohydrate kinase family protein [Vicinamibacterales bacterium]|jgi:sugar/nucleoside kinase (ribokinase family)|nr:carbohydrate kinase family protein [Vicinamibacterales bacterium]